MSPDVIATVLRAGGPALRRTLGGLLALASVACGVDHVAPREETASDAAVYAAVLDFAFAGALPDTVVLSDSIGGHVFREPAPGEESLDSIPDALERKLERATAVSTATPTHALPRPARLISDQEIHEILTIGGDASRAEFARRFAGAQRYLTISPVVYDHDRTQALLFFATMSPTGCGGAASCC